MSPNAFTEPHRRPPAGGEPKVQLPDLKNLHTNIATDVWPSGALLRCGVCGHEVRATPAECGRYLAKGWPAHCGVTMEME